MNTIVRCVAVVWFGLVAVSLVYPARSDDGADDVIVPHFVEFSPPAGFIRSEDSPKAPMWFHPDHDRFPEIEFFFMSAAELVSGDLGEFVRDPSWALLRKHAEHPVWPFFGEQKDYQVYEAQMAGRRVLVMDFMLDGVPGGADYWSRIWIPVDKNVFVEGRVSAKTAEQRDRLCNAVLAAKVKRYWKLPSRG